MKSSIGKVAAAALSRPGSRQMSSTAKVWVDKNTKVICQGFTGKQVRVSLYRWVSRWLWVESRGMSLFVFGLVGLMLKGPSVCQFYYL